MKANERAKERGCELPLTLISKIHGDGMTRQKLNTIFYADRAEFDKIVGDAQLKWESIVWRKEG